MKGQRRAAGRPPLYEDGPVSRRIVLHVTEGQYREVREQARRHGHRIVSDYFREKLGLP